MSRGRLGPRRVSQGSRALAENVAMRADRSKLDPSPNPRCRVC